MGDEDLLLTKKDMFKVIKRIIYWVIKVYHHPPPSIPSIPVPCLSSSARSSQAPGNAVSLRVASRHR